MLETTAEDLITSLDLEHDRNCTYWIPPLFCTCSRSKKFEIARAIDERIAVLEKTLLNKEGQISSYAYVLHSAYPDGTWRGIEKCTHDENDALLVFESYEDACNALRKSDLDSNFGIARIEVILPSVRQSFVDHEGY